MPYYVIRVQDIPKSGRDLNVSTTDSDWFSRVVKDAILIETSSIEATLSAKVTKVEKSIEVVGGVYLKMSVACDRCLVSYDYEQQIPFRMLLEPATKGKVEGKTAEDEVGDLNESLDFSYYSTDELDIGDIIRQHIVIAQPMSHVCSESCKGLCPVCGKNMNKGVCGCKVGKMDSPFKVLKQLKHVDKS